MLDTTARRDYGSTYEHFDVIQHQAAMPYSMRNAKYAMYIALSAPPPRPSFARATCRQQYAIHSSLDSPALAPVSPAVYPLTDAGGESPLLLVNALISEVADVFFSETKTTDGEIEGWVQRKERKKDKHERFLHT